MAITVNRGAEGGMPRSTAEDRRVVPGTPLAVIGLFILALRHRFAASPELGSGFLGGGSVGMGHTPEIDPEDQEPLPWVWDPDITPGDTCTSTSNERIKLLIEAGFNVNNDARNYKPALYVDRPGDVVAQKVVVGSRAGNHLPSGSSSYYALASFPLTVDCYAETDGESAVLADTVWFFLIATRDIFRQEFGLQDISLPTLGRTIHEQEDKEVWRTTITFRVDVNLRWGVRPISPLLQDIALTVEAHYEGNADVFYHQIALRE